MFTKRFQKGNVFKQLKSEHFKQIYIQNNVPNKVKNKQKKKTLNIQTNIVSKHTEVQATLKQTFTKNIV